MTCFGDACAQLTQKQYSWLVTGAAGFIGSHLVEKLLQLKQRVIGLDNFLTGFESNIEKVLLGFDQETQKNFTFLNANIQDLETCKSAVDGVDYILHQAALGSVPRSLDDPISTHQNNVNGTLNLLTAAKDAPVKRFVYASSSSVYGDLETLPKKEELIGKPLSPYALSKLTCENYADTFNRCYGIQSIGLRYFNVFGPRQNPDGPYAAVIPKWAQAILEGQEICINGDGHFSRDFCYVDNAVQANILAALTQNPEAINKVYNVAVGKRTTLLELFNHMKNYYKGEGFLKDVQDPIFKEVRAGDVPHSHADISQAQKYLGYQPTHDIQQGLDPTLAWYKEDIQKKTRQTSLRETASY